VARSRINRTCHDLDYLQDAIWSHELINSLLFSNENPVIPMRYRSVGNGLIFIGE
jgi:hypothetical protein